MLKSMASVYLKKSLLKSRLSTGVYHLCLPLFDVAPAGRRDG